MIVEFVGFPGSGKTSISRRIVRGNGVVDSVVPKANFWQLTRYPVVAARQLPLWRSLRKGWTDRAAFRRLLARRAAQEAVRAQLGSMVIVEEGITHHVWRALMLAPGLGEGSWSPLLRVRHPLVAFEAGDRTLHHRIAGKTNTNSGVVNAHLASLSIDSPEWQQARTLYNQVITRASDDRRVLWVCTDGDLEQAVARVCFAIAAHSGWPDGADTVRSRKI